MKGEETRTCQACGCEISGAMRFCPVCRLRQALDAEAESGELSPESTAKPRFDVDLRCPVALKVISERYLGDESARLHFLREARAAASLRHPNVASVLHLGRTGSSYFYAMEFVEGQTLESLIQCSVRLEIKLALEIAAQVAAGLAAVHKQNLVHRDIKPTNIMVNFDQGDVTGSRDFNSRGVCRNSGVRQSRAIRGRERRYPFGSVFAWRDALGDGSRSSPIPGLARGGDVSTSACSLAA